MIEKIPNTDYIPWPMCRIGKEMERRWESKGVRMLDVVKALNFETPLTWLDLEAYRRRVLNGNHNR